MKKPKATPQAAPTAAHAESCGTCRFSTPSARYKIGSASDALPRSDARLWCRRYPPSITSEFADVDFFATVFADAWCGEHQPKTGGGNA